MNKRAIALIFSLLVVTVLSVLLGAFFFKSVNENNLAKKYVNSTHAFWLAEAGVADALKNFPNSGSSPGSGTLNGYSWVTTARGGGSDYYDIVSTGAVTLPDGQTYSRTVNIVAKRGLVDPSRFQYGIQAANDLCFGGAGSCNKDPNTFLDPDTCNGHPCWKENDATVNFSDLFGHSQSDVEAIAAHYTDTNFMAQTGGAVNGITWIDVAPGSEVTITGSLAGSGILIIEGNVHFGGTYQFDGIVYVLGTLEALGSFNLNGSIIVASSAGVDTVNGNPSFNYNSGQISAGLQELANNFTVVSAWKE